MDVHPTAVVHPDARLCRGVVIGPYCQIGPGVHIGDESVIESHSTIQGPTRLGRANRIGPYAAIGLPPQHLRDSGEETALEVGDENVIREFTSIHRGTREGGGTTRVGNGNYLMSYVHVGHDCHLGNNIILANACNLGGHTWVGDRANLGGMTGCHQFTRIGEYSMIGGASGLRHDVPPYAMVEGNPARLRGLNVTGLRRNGFSPEVVARIKRSFKIVFWSGKRLEEAVRAVQEEFGSDKFIDVLIRFLGESKRGVCRPGPADDVSDRG
jgi:UDP-N-acetylglucosamine acyltransferase